jgi:hypothetical protein
MAAQSDGSKPGVPVAVRTAYAVAALGLIVVYPWLSTAGRMGTYRVVSLASIVAVLVGPGRTGQARGVRYG